MGGGSYYRALHAAQERATSKQRLQAQAEARRKRVADAGIEVAGLSQAGIDQCAIDLIAGIKPSDVALLNGVSLQPKPRRRKRVA